MNGLIIFGLLILLMATGMPISIALGLTVLTFIFGFTNVPDAIWEAHRRVAAALEQS